MTFVAAPYLPFSLLSLLLASLPSTILASPLAAAPPSAPSPPPPRSSGPIPDYVLKHAPLIHLAENELYWPSSLQSHLDYTRLRFSANASLVPDPPSSPLTTDNLGFVGNRSDLFLAAGVRDDDMKAGRADWLASGYGKPDWRGRSESEVVILLVDKRDIIAPGYLDAFYFTFYSYNEGNTLFGTRYGDHIGDWEHVMIRYLNGEPQQVFLSEHAYGEVWPYDVISKAGPNLPEGRAPKSWGWDERPLVYSAEGSHALYGTPGIQEYILPFGLLSDHTSPGPIWDPTLNYRSFWLNTSTSTWWTQYLTFVPTEGNDWSVSFLDYAGRWGDEFWLGAKAEAGAVEGQYCYLGNCRYVNGPFGPRYKYLDRRILNPIDFTFDLILAICCSLLLSTMGLALVRRIRRPPSTSNKRSGAYFTHLFPFCFFSTLSLTPEPVKRPTILRQRRSTWYQNPDERTPLL